jgi:hypothetical protein
VSDIDFLLQNLKKIKENFFWKSFGFFFANLLEKTALNRGIALFSAVCKPH